MPGCFNETEQRKCRLAVIIVYKKALDACIKVFTTLWWKVGIFLIQPVSLWYFDMKVNGKSINFITKKGERHYPGQERWWISKN